MDDRYSAKARSSKLDDAENAALGTGKYKSKPKPKKPKAKKPKKTARQKLDDDFWR